MNTQQRQHKQQREQQREQHWDIPAYEIVWMRGQWKLVPSHRIR